MVSRFSILCNAAAAHFSGSSGQTAVQEVNGRDGVFLYFLGYGFLGYLLEKLFAALTHAEHRVRKGFLLAPVCPVYGLAMCAVLALGADRIGPLWELALLCSITATTAEYAVHLFCDAVLGVRFWDYSATKTDVNGRICLPFSLAWGVLGALAVRLVQPALAALAAGIPSAVTNTVLLCLGIDALWSTGVLLRWGDIDLLAPSRLRRKYRTA